METLRLCVKLTRLDKFPLGSLVIFWPAAFGVTMASYAFNTSVQDFLTKIGIFAVGGTLLHSTFCVLNDICDKDLDGMVERTKSRPLVAGTASLTFAWVLFLGFLSATLFLLSFAQPLAVSFGMLSLPLHFTYPLSKRWTWWPQAWLGISNGWSYFVGWLSVAGERSSSTQVKATLAINTYSWTIYFDTIYATQDRKDDTRIGVKSTARLFGSRLREITALFAVATIVLMTSAGVLNHHGTPYFIISCAVAAAHFVWQVMSWDTENDRQSGELFKANGNLGYFIFLGMVADYARQRLEVM
ncbi:UbiA prenyltransferase family [Vararia minispora EC-137]|uniref:UbiA prenyltransferase family n=1 Tax=Vararia minispora EC-137 TaxID=1314806 RepID=A0ACB8QWP4_9AGAM|nr:UbiA prenyltransferase family [Vararia minispora EC-137]